MKIQLRKFGGFTLVEIAIVLVIVSVLLGYTVAMLPVQQEIKQYRAVNEEMDKIIDAIYAYAQVNDRLPCADNLAAPDGRADPDTGVGDCTQWYGLLPAKTLGIDGNYDANNSLLDPWGTPYRYQVSKDDDNGDGDQDFVETAAMKAVGLADLDADLEICTVNPSVNPTDAVCTNAPETMAVNIPAVVLSLGKDRGNINSDIQGENTDNTADGDTDIVFVKTTRSDVTATHYDDIVKWITPNILFSKMIEAGHLP